MKLDAILGLLGNAIQGEKFHFKIAGDSGQLGL